MIIYADIYVAVNFIADFMLLYITGHFMKYEKKLWRISVSSLLASIIALLSELYLYGIHSFFASVIIPSLMLFVSFGKKSLIAFFESFIIFFGTSFVVGGIMTAISERCMVISKPLVYIIFFAIFIFCFLYFDIFSLKKDCDWVDITLKTKTGEKNLKLLCDSGCVAKEPISGLPVILLSPKTFDSLYLPEDRKNKDFILENKLRLIPIRTAVGSGIIEAVIPENIVCKYKNKKINCSAAIGRSKESSFSGTDGIFPASLL